jgi:RHS repeat-associated protein
VGNRTAKTSVTPLSGNVVITYAYGAANRLVLSLSKGEAEVDGVAYTWDERGDLIHDGVFTYTYDAAGRMVGAEGVTQTLAYTYTADGLRVAENAGGEVTTFIWDLASPLAQVLATSDGAAYVHGLDLVAERRSGAWAYPLGDALGSVRQWTDEDGYVDYAGGYTPFGTQMWTEGSTSSSWGYTGEWWDSYRESLYLRARWLDVGSGRFTSPDPIVPRLRNPQSINGYTYAFGNPVSYSDPSGLVPVPPYLPNHRDLTYWLYDELHANANGYYAQRIRTLLASDDLGDKARAVLAWILLVKNKAMWDPKHQIRYELGRSIVLGHANGYRWYEYSVPGNIHYSFVGRAVGFSGSALHGGAGFAEIIDPAHAEAGESCCPRVCWDASNWQWPITYLLHLEVCIPLGCYYVNPTWRSTLFDDPADWQSVEFGAQMFNVYGPRLTLEQFQDFLATYGQWLTPAPTAPAWYWTNPRGGWPYEVGHFDGPDTGRNGRWVMHLLRGK